MGAELDVQGIEARADAILAQIPSYVWDGESLPIPVADIADTCFNLRICEVPAQGMTAVPGCPPLDENQSISGLLLASRGEIWVNADEAREWPTRGRFTVCHELGHHVLHRAGQQSLFCRHGQVAEAHPTTRPPLPITEEEANAFAAALLMPARLLRHHYDFCDPGNRFEELCELFGASGAAMGRRLHAVI